MLVNILPLKGWMEDDCTYICWCITGKTVVFVKLCPARVDRSGHKRVVLVLCFTSFVLAKKPIHGWEGIIKSIAVRFKSLSAVRQVCKESQNLLRK
jgi:hypothetical protein